MRMARMTIATLIFATLLLGCSSRDIANSEFEVDALHKVRTGQYVLIKADELAQLRTDAEIARSVGRYQIHTIGIRTWRLDTATGASCLLLTTESDAKKAETVAQACPKEEIKYKIVNGKLVPYEHSTIGTAATPTFNQWKEAQGGKTAPKASTP